MSKQDLKKQLSETLDELNSLLELAETPEQQQDLRKQIHDLSANLDKLIITALQATTSEYNDAIVSLKNLVQEARTVRADIRKFEKVISKSAKALTKVEKLFKNVSHAVT